jgi:siderophore synthetase component
MTTRYPSLSSAQQPTTEQSLQLAEKAEIERLLNIFWRENELAALQVNVEDFPVLKDLPDQETGGYAWFAIPLKKSAGFLLGQRLYFSPQSYHRYGNTFWHLAADRQQVTQIEGWQDLAEHLLSEIETENTPEQQQRKQELLRDIAGSIEKTAIYAAWHNEHTPSPFVGSRAERFLAAEQSLVFGHPFHPTPKSARGTLATNIQPYAPETGSSFALHYFALASELVAEEYLDSHSSETVIPASVTAEARQRLSQPESYRLLPCHPWQADFLRQSQEIKQLQESGSLIDLGPLGEPVAALSSVRTVCDPTHSVMFKLPLHMRITNFIRTNPAEHVRRSFDASRLIQHLGTFWSYDGFTVVQEQGYRGVNPEAFPRATYQWLFENLAVLFRENPLVSSEKTPLVLAGILEPSVHDNIPSLIRALQTAQGSTQIRPSHNLVVAWLERYLHYSLLPLIELFIEHGISLEAHVQNTMVALENGWPVACFVRDMEGTSVSRARSWFNHLLREGEGKQSPLLLPDDEAWHRLKYYFFTNHLGHLISTLAFYCDDKEASLWPVVRHTLEKSRFYRTARGRSYLDDLFQTPSLPAKENLLSRLLGCSEKPLYVPVTNLMTLRM